MHFTNCLYQQMFSKISKQGTTNKYRHFNFIKSNEDKTFTNVSIYRLIVSTDIFKNTKSKIK